MNHAKRTTAAAMTGCVLLLSASGGWAQDWPQWRGPNRDNKVTDFTEPKTWPKELTQKWSVKVGVGDASPVLVGDKVYAFTRVGDEEVITCLDAAKGTEVWHFKYKAGAVTNRAAQGHPGPRSSPAVANGKVCTFGVAGAVTCVDAAKGDKVWQKDTNAMPQFSTSASPIIVDGKCIVFIGDNSKGALTAYDLATGDEKWKWDGDSPAYGSPVLMTVDKTKMVVTLAKSGLVGVGADDGKLLFKTAYSANYNSGTPVVDGQTVICSGPAGRGGGGKSGTVAFKIEKKGDAFEAKELYSQPKSPAGIYNTPVLKDGLLYGLTGGQQLTNIFCAKADTGEILWTDSAKRGGCGEILDAGSVLFALTSDKELVVFKPSDKAFTEVAKYKVADTDPWAYPIIAGNRIFVKDKENLILWTIE